MPFVPSLFSDSNLMRWDPDFATNNAAAFRAWVNSIPAGDVSSGAIRREHLVRPKISGLLAHSFVSTFQQSHSVDYGIGQSSASPAKEWGPRRYRLAITPPSGDGFNQYFYLPIQRRVRLRASSDVEVHATYEFQTRSVGIRSPNGAGIANGARGGFFAIHARKFGTGADTVYLEGQDFVYPNTVNVAGDAGPNHQYGGASMVDTLVAGTWDLMLVYHRGPAPTGLLQIDLSRVTLNVEVL